MGLGNAILKSVFVALFQGLEMMKSRCLLSPQKTLRTSVIICSVITESRGISSTKFASGLANSFSLTGEINREAMVNRQRKGKGMSHIEVFKHENSDRGFQMNFDNGWTVSVQFGHGNYCNNREFFWTDSDTPSKCDNAEIAAWDNKGNWWDFGGGVHVKGWVSPDQIAVFIAGISMLEKGDDVGIRASLKQISE